MLTKFTEYGGEAEVLGVSRRVSFAASVLSVCGLTMEQANEILRKLSLGEHATHVVEPDRVIIRLAQSRTVTSAEVDEVEVTASSKAPVRPNGVSSEEYAAQEEEILSPNRPTKEVPGGGAQGGREADSVVPSAQPTSGVHPTPPPVPAVPQAGAQEASGSTAVPPEPPASGVPSAPAAAPSVLSPVAEAQVPAAKEHLAALTDEAKASAEEDQLIHALRQQTLVKGILTVLEESGCVGLEALTARCVALKDKVPLLGHITNFNERIARTYGLMHPGK
jgi:hypothetical protein